MSDLASRTLLVIPCFNESPRVRPFLQSLREQFRNDDRVSVLVVDDGSGAEEQARMHAIVEAERAQWPRLRPLLAIEINQGKGGAIYAGWAAHEGEGFLAFVDADGSCRASEVARLIEEARAGGFEHAVFASRVKMLGRDVERRWTRHLLGRVFATLVSELLAIPVYDSQCGLKVVPRAAFERIRPVLEIRRFAFDAELLCALWDAGVRVEEVPVHWHEVAGGKVRILRDSWRMFRDVWDIRTRRQSKAWRVVAASPARS